MFLCILDFDDTLRATELDPLHSATDETNSELIEYLDETVCASESMFEDQNSCEGPISGKGFTQTKDHEYNTSEAEIVCFEEIMYESQGKILLIVYFKDILIHFFILHSHNR